MTVMIYQALRTFSFPSLPLLPSQSCGVILWQKWTLNISDVDRHAHSCDTRFKRLGAVMCLEEISYILTRAHVLKGRQFNTRRSDTDCTL